MAGWLAGAIVLTRRRARTRLRGSLAPWLAGWPAAVSQPRRPPEVFQRWSSRRRKNIEPKYVGTFFESFDQHFHEMLMKSF
jgi:hypothetical protein